MKIFNVLTVFTLSTLVSVATCFGESIVVSPLTSENLNKFERSILSNYQEQTVYSLRDLKTGKELSSVLGQKTVSPASVQKLITTFAALKELSGEFKFHTDFIYLEKPSSLLIVKGYGDPAMTDERLYKAVDDLYRAGVRKIQKLVLDDSSFIDPRKRTGINPYQAAQSALTLNFNTLNVRGQLIDDKKIFSKTSFSSLELSPRITIGNSPGISISDNGQKISLSLTSKASILEDNIAVEDPVSYFAEAFVGMLKLRGIEAPAVVSVSEIDTDVEPIVVSYSKDLASILADMNRYSSNFLAGQITYQLGLEKHGKMSFEKGLETLSKYVDGENLLSDGSGLSRNNRLTASGLSKLIAKAMSDQAIAADFQGSLSRFGRRGTLKHRELKFPGEDKIWAKTGTIDGVSSIAGTIELKDTSLAAFVIITNGPVSKSESTSREDFILRSFLAADNLH